MVSYRSLRVIQILAALTLVTAFAVNSALAQPVKSFQKISATQGGFAAAGGVLVSGDDFGEAVDAIGDLDGDGLPELIVGTQRDDDGGPNRGAVYVIFLNSDGTVKRQQKISSTQGWPGADLNDEDTFGIGATGVGDLDDDGVEDIAVGASRQDNIHGNNRGAVYILFLNPDGTVKSHQKISSVEGGFGVTSETFLGQDLEMLGDLDGDGNGDLFVSASGGEFYIFYLNDDGTVKSWRRNTDNAGSGGWGQTGALIGDLDDDGIMDIVTGAQFDDDGGSNRGAIWTLFMNADGSIRSRVKVSDTTGGFGGQLQNGDEFGQSVTPMGDLNNDGIPDLAVGAEHADSPDGTVSNTGDVWILLMNRNGTVLSEHLITSGSENFTTIAVNANIGQAVTFVGDLNNDGVGDLVTTADGDNDGGTQVGSAFVIFLEPFNPADSASNSAPSVNNPGQQDSLIGDSVSLQINGDDPDFDTLSYSSIALPDGLSISSDGLITGSPTTAGVYSTTITVEDPDGFLANTTFFWNVRSGQASQQSGVAPNLLVVESENYINRVSRNGQNWQFGGTQLAGGGGYMAALPENGVNAATDYVSNAPRLDYAVNFATAGTHYVWVRGFSPDTGANSVHLGLDGVDLATTMRVDDFALAAWDWSNLIQVAPGDLQVARIEVDTTGTRTLNVWMREDGFQIDKVLITTDPAYVPDGLGPAQSPQVGVNEAPVISPVADQQVTSGDLLTVAISAADADGPGDIELRANNLPAGAQLNDFGGGSAELTWTPDDSDIPNNPHTIEIVATDNDGAGAQSTLDFDIIVNPVGGPNNDPVLTNPGSLSNVQGDVISLQMIATDADGNDLTYSASNLPLGLSIDDDGLITGTALDNDVYTVTVTVDDGFAGEDMQTFQWTITANNGGVFQQATDAGNLLVIDAENFSNNVAQGAHTWARQNSGGASGGAVMVSTPNIGTNNSTEYLTSSPRLDFTANFTSTGTHYLWVRAFAPNTGADSVHVGFDGVDIPSSRRVDSFDTGTFDWSNLIQVAPGDLQVATIEVDSLGQHTLNLWMREDGFQVDKLILTTDPAFVPNGQGPAQSSQVPLGNQPPQLAFIADQLVVEDTLLTVPITATDADGTADLVISAENLPGDADITDSGNGSASITWTPINADVAGSPYAVTVRVTDGEDEDSQIFNITVNAVGANNDPVLTSPGDQTSTVNQAVSLQISATDLNGDDLTFDATGLPTGLDIDEDGLITGTPTVIDTFTPNITVSDGNGGEDDVDITWVIEAVASGVAFQQSTDSGNLLVMEAENFTQNTAQGAHTWNLQNAGGASNGAVMIAAPESTTNNGTGYLTNSPRLDFDAEFVATGTHYIWVRGFAQNAGADSVHLGLDGVDLASSRRVDDFTVGVYDWSNLVKLSASVLQVGTIEVSSTGRHTVNVWMREDGFQIDKIVLTTDPSFVPVDLGPPESPRDSGGNEAPVIDAIPQQTVNAGDPLVVNFAATDADGPAPLTMDVQNLPVGAGFTDSGGGVSQLTWTPQVADVANSPFSVTVLAADGDNAESSRIFSIVVNPAGGVNTPPVLTNPGDQENLLGDVIDLQLVATDADGHTVDFDATDLPPGLGISLDGRVTGTANQAGTYAVTVMVDDRNGGEDDASFSWVILPASGSGPFQQSNAAGNLLVVDAENATGNTPQGVHSWDLTSNANAAGGEAMVAAPNNGTSNKTGYVSTSPRLDFAAEFVTSGTHYVWVRGFSPNSAGDSVHIGLNGIDLASSRRIDEFTVGSWVWTNQIRLSSTEVQVATIDIPSAGPHTVNAWMREDGFVLDKIVLTTDPAFVPAGFGPAQSGRVGGVGGDPDADRDGIADAAETIAGAGSVLIDDFETNQGWVIDPDGTDTATTGIWEVANPGATSSGSTTVQLGTTTSGVQALVTDGDPGGSVGAFDIDSGVTSALSPVFVLPANAQNLNLNYYFAHLSSGTAVDFLEVRLVGTGIDRVVVNETGDGTNRGGVWTPAVLDVSDIGGAAVQLRVSAADAGNGSIVEAGIDDVVVTTLGAVSDTDSDGFDNINDLDSDGDSIADILEVGLTDVNDDGQVDSVVEEGSILSPRDTDSDGIPDFLDLESNNPANDGTAYDIASTPIQRLDSNGDGLVNQLDAGGGNDLNGNGIDDLVDPAYDSDSDGVRNGQDAFPNDASESADSDNDGVGDNADAFPNDPTETSDFDRDGVGDNTDTDADNDGITNAAETPAGDSNIVIHAGKTGSGYNLSSGSQLTLTRDALLNVNNYGPAGVVVVDSVTIIDSVGTLSAADLDGVDILFDGWVETDDWSTAELDAIEAWVNAGGVLVSTNDDTDHDGVSTRFGAQVLGSSDSTWEPEITHPITDGDFGSWSSISTSGNEGYFNLPAGWTVIAEDTSGDPTIIENSVGSGHVILIGDEGVFRVSGSNNENFARNVFAYAISLLPITSGSEDMDNDGAPNAFDLDSDNDGIPDIVEAGLTDSDVDYFVDSPTDEGSVLVAPDSDADGLPDFLDLESGNAANDGTAFDLGSGAANGLDSNGDGQLNSDDAGGGLDADEDGVDDLIDTDTSQTGG